MANTIPVRDESWPEGAVIHVRDKVKAGVINGVQAITQRTRIKAQEEGAEFSTERSWQPMLYAALMVQRFEGDWLLEQLDDAAKLLGRDGSMPDMEKDRLTVAEEIPFHIIGVIDAKVAELMRPLAATATPSESNDSSDASGPPSTKTSKTPAKKT